MVLYLFNNVLIILLLISGCSVSGNERTSAELETVASVDLSRYQGRWYEIARLPMWFQRGCVRSMATYTLLESGKVRVENECLTNAGKRKRAEGYAYVVDKKSNSKLEVVFDNWFSKIFPFLTKGKYWILYLDSDYQTAIVATPNRKYLWILARTPRITEETYARLVAFCEDRGFRTESLIRDRSEDEAR